MAMDRDEIVGLVPAAGEGNRLLPFSKAVPKEMYPILGKAVIEHCIENLKEGGIRNMYIIVGHQKGALMDYVGDGSFYGVNVAYIYQFERKGLGHAILQSRNWINKSFTVLLGDSFIEPKREMHDLISLHKRRKPIATILLFEVSDPSGYGIAKINISEGNSGLIEKLIEKPTVEQAAEYRTNGKYYAICGAYVFEPEIFDYISRTKPGAKGEVQVTDSISLAIENGKEVYGLVLKGKYIDIGKWNTVLRTEKEMIMGSDIDFHIKEREDMMKRFQENNLK